MHKFRENDTVYYITGEYPNQKIEIAKIEFFFDHVSIVNGIKRTKKLACIRTDHDIKGGKPISELFSTPDDARNAIEKTLNELREKYWSEIHESESIEQNIITFALNHDVSNIKNDPIARKIMLAYGKSFGLNVPSE